MMFSLLLVVVLLLLLFSSSYYYFPFFSFPSPSVCVDFDRLPVDPASSRQRRTIE
ncbi:hypothetical protein BDQ94DRAFT_139941 [Aspergillus welwitschiae]|uniref:Uncharacterized protein n=1 Tax=Aspergillus welwitschiae TaxID=1341132 RepID=A0A3F3Q9Y4_9EURO|nr:hypothetical protein BDQ94DRAFT_139941 [Aspergillus welwitschiae]RDH35622.1 hypothetical protein BDQ94DRAFT_139941 [Aspergillus welwitschiae]